MEALKITSPFGNLFLIEPRAVAANTPMRCHPLLRDSCNAEKRLWIKEIRT